MQEKFYERLIRTADTVLKDPSAGEPEKELWSQVAKIASKSRNEGYEKLGIYENGDVVTTGTHKECFLDCTADLAFIRNLKGVPYELSMGLKCWPRSQADCDVLFIGSLEAWVLLYLNGWLEWEPAYDGDDNPLRWALQSRHVKDHKVYGFLYALFPETDLKDMFWRVPTLSAARWLDQAPHKADKNYQGLSCTMEQAVRWAGHRETPEIAEYLYGPERKETK